METKSDGLGEFDELNPDKEQEAKGLSAVLDDTSHRLTDLPGLEGTLKLIP